MSLLVRDHHNSTTTPLLANGTFTGEPSRLDQWAQINVTMHFRPNVVPNGDANTAQGSLYVDFSPDGTNWDINVPIVVRSGLFIPQTYIPTGAWFRVRYVNDGGAGAITALGLTEAADTARDQTQFRLQTDFLRESTKELGRTIDQGVDGSNPVSLVRSVIMGKDPSGSYINTQVNEQGDLRVANFDLEIAKGNILEHQLRRKFGYIANLGTPVDLGTPTTWVDTWNYGGLRTSPTTSFTPYMASTSTSDTDVDVTWTYLDGAGVEQEVTVNTNGQTSVSLGVTATEVYAGYVSGATANVGDIRVMSADNFSAGVPQLQSQVLASISVNDKQTQVLALRIPSDMTAYGRSLSVTTARASGAATSVKLAFERRLTGSVFRNIKPVDITNTVTFDMSGVVFPSSSDIRLRIRDVSDNNTTISAEFRYYLVNN